MSFRRVALGAVAAIAFLVLLTPATWHTFHGFMLVARGVAPHGGVHALARLDAVDVKERLLVVPVGGAPMRARAYVPAAQGRPRQAVLLVSGLHPAGIDEPRLIHLSRTLAESNVLVVTPDIPELSRFDITTHVTDRIEAAAVWLALESGFAPDGRIGLMGVSFSGGLAVVAAGRPSLRGRLRYVFSFGGHDDLRRVLDYFCAGGDPSDETGPPEQRLMPGAPHDYGVAIALLAVADQLVPADQLTDFKEAVRRFLWASYLDRTDKDRADREFAALRDVALTMPEPSATLLAYVNARDVTRLGGRLRPYVGEYAETAGLSPARSPLPDVPVFLLHGRDDTVIPAAESERLAERLRGRTRVRLLLTDLISHADAEQAAHTTDVLRLAAFWGDLLSR